MVAWRAATKPWIRLAAAASVATGCAREVGPYEGGDSAGAADVAPLAPPSPARLLAPGSTAFVPTGRPTLRWTLEGGARDVTVRVCRDRALTRSCLERSVAADSLRPDVALSPGLWFWAVRLRRAADGAEVSSPTWQFAVGVRETGVDTSWGVAADFDGDGRAELLVGLPQAGSGRVEVYSGDTLAAQRSAVLRGPEQPGSWFGSVVTAAGDVDGDGHGDALVAAPGANGRGRVYVYHGGPAGLSPTPAAILDVPPQASGSFGYDLSPLGDTNADGYADVAITAYGDRTHRAGEVNHGYVFVYPGGASGLAATPAQVIRLGFDSPANLSVAALGDVDGDGRGDLAVGLEFLTHGATEASYAQVLLASAHGFAVSRTLHGVADAPDPAFGATIAPAGDANGDGYADFVVGSGNDAGTPGAVYFYAGGRAGPAQDPTSVVRGGATGSYLGEDVAGAGDLDGDGYGDLVIARSPRDPLAEWTRAVVVRGGPEGPRFTEAIELSVGGAPAVEGHVVGYGGCRVAGPGDVDADGLADVFVIAQRSDVTAASADVLGLFVPGRRDATLEPTVTMRWSLAPADAFGLRPSAASATAH